MRNNSYQAAAVGGVYRAAAGCRALPRPGNKYPRSQCVNTQNEAYTNVAAGSYYCCRFCARQQAPIYILAPCSNNDISAAHLIILGMLCLGFSLTLQFHLLGLQLGFNRKNFVLISLISWHSTTTLVAQYSF